MRAPLTWLTAVVGASFLTFAQVQHRPVSGMPVTSQATTLHLAYAQGASAQPVATTVYVCTGVYATKYHYTSGCRGLNNCKGDIVEVDLARAREAGRTLCGWED